MTEETPVDRTPLVVGTDPQSVWKAFRPGIIVGALLIPVTAILAVGFAAWMGDSSGFAAGVLASMPIVFLGVYVSFSTMYFLSLATARAAAGTVLTLTATGLASTTPQGTLVLPWQSVASVQVKKVFRNRVIIFRLAGGVTRDSPGVQTSMNPAAFRRLCRTGFQLGSVGIDIPIESILEATADLTVGRLTPR